MSILGRRRPHAPCVECGEQVVQRVGEPNSNFWRRQTCSDPCAHRMRHDVAEKLAALSGRSCGCGRPIIHREGEDLTNFGKRKTCCEPGCIRARKVKMTGGRSMRPAPAVQIDDDLMSYGQGFHSQNIPDPGDGGPIRLSKPLPDGVGSVSGRYL